MSPLTLRVKELRLAKNWSQQELADRAGLARLTITKIESGKTTRIEFSVLEKLADAFSVDPAVLLERTPKKRGQ